MIMVDMILAVLLYIIIFSLTLLFTFFAFAVLEFVNLVRSNNDDFKYLNDDFVRFSSNLNIGLFIVGYLLFVM